MMMCIYAYIVNQLAGLQQIRTHWSLLGPINTSLSHLFVHAAVNQAMHTTSLLHTTCNTTLRFFYCTKSMDTRVRTCMLVPGCMHVSLGRARGKVHFVP